MDIELAVIRNPWGTEISETANNRAPHHVVYQLGKFFNMGKMIFPPQKTLCWNCKEKNSL